MLSRLLREFLLKLVHLLVSVISVLQNVYYRFWVENSLIIEDTVTKDEVKLILEHVPKMKKRVKHMVILADTDHHSVSDLAKVVIWSLVAGVPYVSFYDISGNLTKKEEKLFLEIECNKKGIPGCIKWSNKPDLNGYSNGHQAHTIIVNIFTKEDGRPKIIDCIRKIAEDKIPCHKNSKDSSEYTAQELSEALMYVYPPFPDPEIALYTGVSCCLYGLLPWQIRLTEFIQLSQYHLINIHSYLGALYKFNKCDQRFGK